MITTNSILPLSSWMPKLALKCPRGEKCKIQFQRPQQHFYQVRSRLHFPERRGGFLRWLRIKGIFRGWIQCNLAGVFYVVYFQKPGAEPHLWRPLFQRNSLHTHRTGTIKGLFLNAAFRLSLIDVGKISGSSLTSYILSLLIFIKI